METNVDNNIETTISPKVYWDDDVEVAFTTQSKRVFDLRELTTLLKDETAIGIRVMNNKVEVLFKD